MLDSKPHGDISLTIKNLIPASLRVEPDKVQSQKSPWSKQELELEKFKTSVGAKLSSFKENLLANG